MTTVIVLRNHVTFHDYWRKKLTWQPRHALRLASLKTTCHGNKVGKIEKHHVCTWLTLTAFTQQKTPLKKKINTALQPSSMYICLSSFVTQKLKWKEAAFQSTQLPCRTEPEHPRKPLWTLIPMSSRSIKWIFPTCTGKAKQLFSNTARGRPC